MDTAPLPGVIQETRGFNVIFIHSALDDAGLSPAEFRVYSHLARRASSGSAWPSVRSIAAVCQLNKDTVCSALNVLEARCMVRRERRGFASTIYFLTPCSEWLSESEGQAALSEMEGQGVRNGGTLPVRKEGTEGNPVEGNPQKVLQPNTHPELPAVAGAGAATGERGEWKAKRLPRSNEAVRLARMFDRGLTQSWAEGEIAAFRNLCPFNPEELNLIERFYVANWHLADNPQRCRKGLLALLQNWSIELDKARAWCRSHPEKKKRAALETPEVEPPGFGAWIKQNYPGYAHLEWEGCPGELKNMYLRAIRPAAGQKTFKDEVP